LENLRVFEDGVSAPVGCLLGSVGGGVIVAGLSFKRRSWTLCLWQGPLFPRKRTWSGYLCLRHERTLRSSQAIITSQDATW
jgi:hypothetical protein